MPNRPLDGGRLDLINEDARLPHAGKCVEPQIPVDREGIRSNGLYSIDLA
jgi:hypothetical protein